MEKMSYSREELTDKILDSYRAYFDVNPLEGQKGLVARCDFHVHNEKYVLVKSAKLWQADCHEYVYVFSVPSLTQDVFKSCEEYVCREGFSLVEPKEGHMYTYITAVFVCDDFTKEAAGLLKRSRRYKSYKFSIHGWAELRVFAVRAEDKKLISNGAGRQCSKFVKKL